MQKPGPPRDIPPPLELECLKALWDLGNGTVKDVRAVLTDRRKLAYTTVMTVLARLTRRGSATRRKQGRSFLYTPLRGRDEMRTLAVKELVDSLFDGSEEELRVFLAGEKRPEPEPARPAPEPVRPIVDDHLDTELL